MFWILNTIVFSALVIFIFSRLLFYFRNIGYVKDHAIIKFDDFVKYYSINPEKWDLREMRVGYTPKSLIDLDKSMQQHFLNRMDLYKNSYLWEEEREKLKIECLGKRFYRFSFIDCMRYKRWHENIEEEKKRKNNSEKHRKDIISLLEGVQKDIDKLRKQSQDELNQAVNTMKEVKERIG